MRKLSVLCVALLMAVAAIFWPPRGAKADHAPHNLDPILFIPGTAGSVLKFVPGTEPRPLGIVLGEAWPDVNRAIWSGWRNMDPMRLKPDGKNSHYNHIWYPTEPIYWAELYFGQHVSDIYGSFLENFLEKELHMMKGRDFDTFAYDWMRVEWSRDANGEDKRTVERLRDKIRYLSAINGGRDVVLISHSLGGLIARDYIVKYQGEKVKAHIGMATPYQGTMMTYQTLRWGWNFGIPTVWSSSIQELSGNWPVAYRLLAMGALAEQPFLWTTRDQTPAWTYDKTSPGPDAVPVSLSESWAYARNRNETLFDQARDWRNAMFNGEDYGVRQYNIVGRGRPTVYGFKTGTVTRTVQNMKVTRQEWVPLETLEGDNTIPLASATLTDWQGRPVPAEEGVGSLQIRMIDLPTHCGTNMLLQIECKPKGHTDIPALAETQSVVRELLIHLAGSEKPPVHRPFPYKLTLNPYWDGNTLRMSASVRLTDIGLPRDDLGEVHSGTVTFEVFRPSCIKAASLATPYRSVQAKMPSGFWIQPTGLIGSAAAVEIPVGDASSQNCIHPGDGRGYSLDSDLFHVRATFQPRDGKQGGRTLRYDAITAQTSIVRQRFPGLYHKEHSDLNWIPDRGRAIEADTAGWDRYLDAPVIYTTDGAPRVRFTRYVDVPWTPHYATLGLLVDDRATVYVNGSQVGTVTGFTRKEYLRFPLEPGRNTIEVDVENWGGPAGFSASLLVNRDPVKVSWTYARSKTDGHYNLEYRFTRQITGEPVEGVGYYIVWDDAQAEGKTGKDGRVAMTVPVKASYRRNLVISPGEHYTSPRSEGARQVNLPEIPILTYANTRLVDGKLVAAAHAASRTGPVVGLTLEAEVRGRTYTAKTDENGHAWFNLGTPPEPGDYAMLVRVIHENMIAEPLSAWMTVVRLDRRKKPAISAAVSAGELNLRLADGERPIPGQHLVVTYQGVPTTVVTDRDGTVSWQFDPPDADEAVDIVISHRSSGGFMTADPLTVAANGLSVRYSSTPQLPVAKELAAQPGADGVLLSWGAFGTPHDGYYVFRGTAPGQYHPVPLSDFPLLETTFTDAKAEPGRTSYYVVRNYRAESGETPASSKESMAVVPAEQRTLTAKPERGSVSLSWSPFGRPHDGYYVFRGAAPGQYDSTPLTDFPLRETAFVDTKVQPVRTYYYVIRTYRTDSGEYGTSSIEASVVP